MKKRKILIPAGIAAGIVIGAVIWQGTRPGEVTNFNKSFEAEQQAPGEESTQSAGAAAGIQVHHNSRGHQRCFGGADESGGK